MSPPNPKALKLAINKKGTQKVHFALEGDGFVPANGKLEVRRKGETGSWKCMVLNNYSSAIKLVGWFLYHPRSTAEEKNSDDRDTEELEFVVTNPDGSQKSLFVPTTVVDDTP